MRCGRNLKRGSLAWTIGLLCLTARLPAEEQREGDWLVERNNERDFAVVMTRELVLHPQAEPKPALMYQLIPDDFERSDGNSAIYYLKAMGFLEETRAREVLNEFDRKAQEKAEQENSEDWPPYSWISMPPAELPVEEAKEYLRLLRFQPPLLHEAAHRRTFSLDRNIRQTKDPISYLLPEIQTMRQLARYQSLRIRLAIAEGRVADAIEILGQQYAMAEHLGQDEFFVSSLVGIAISGMAWSDALYLVQHAEAPNLYWAFAALPKPLVGMNASLAYERQLLFEQVKSLRDVDEQVRPPGYWQDFLTRILPEISTLISLEGDWNFSSDDPKVARTALAAMIAASYPGAKQYLVRELMMPLNQVEAYSKTQTVFLATKRYSERARDEQLKWQHIPLWQVQSIPLSQQTDEKMRDDAARIGWITKPVQIMLPALVGVMSAQQRAQQHVALLQTVEAIRIYMADHDGRLPRSLDLLPLPAMLDPLNGKAFVYEHHGDSAVLRGTRAGNVRYQLVLRVAD